VLAAAASSAPWASKSPSAASRDPSQARRPASRPAEHTPHSPAGHEPASPALPRARLRFHFSGQGIAASLGTPSIAHQQGRTDLQTLPLLSAGTGVSRLPCLVPSLWRLLIVVATSRRAGRRKGWRRCRMAGGLLAGLAGTGRDRPEAEPCGVSGPGTGRVITPWPGHVLLRSRADMAGRFV
jgi:hypothetical protein